MFSFSPPPHPRLSPCHYFAAEGTCVELGKHLQNAFLPQPMYTGVIDAVMEFVQAEVIQEL